MKWNDKYDVWVWPVVSIAACILGAWLTYGQAPEPAKPPYSLYDDMQRRAPFRSSTNPCVKATYVYLDGAVNTRYIDKDDPHLLHLSNLVWYVFTPLKTVKVEAPDSITAIEKANIGPSVIVLSEEQFKALNQKGHP